jgi:ribosomal protein S18 acetylase RimI-like enzyme
VIDGGAGRGLPVRLHVLKVNSRAAGFYRRLGFRDAGADDTHIKLERPADGSRPTEDH